jgi:hypothetical protein
MRRLLIASLFLAISSWASPAKADLLNYELVGHVTSVDPTLDLYMPGVAVGTPVQATLGYRPPLVPSVPPDYGMDLFLGGYGICTSSNGHNAGSSLLIWSIPMVLCEGSLAQSMSLDYLQLIAVSVDPLTLPATIVFYGLDFLCRERNGCFDDTPGFSASIDSIATIPDTGSTFVLMLVVLCGVILIKRRRERSWCESFCRV